MSDEAWGNSGKMEEAINEFPIYKKIKFSEVIHVIGSPGSGKTHFILFLSYALKHIYPVAQIYCGTEDTQNAFSPVFGGAFVSSTYDEFQHKRAFMRQTLCKKEKCEYNGMISIIDDMAADKGAIKSSKNGGPIVKAHKNGAQWFDELLVMGYQSVQDISDEIINVPSKVFVFYEGEDSNRRKLHRHYFKTVIPNYTDFNKLMNDICGQKDDKFNCLVVDLRAQSSDLSECVYYFKAPAWKWKKPQDPKKPMKGCPEGWRFGCKQYQEWSNLRWDPNAIPQFIQDLQQF